MFGTFSSLRLRDLRLNSTPIPHVIVSLTIHFTTPVSTPAISLGRLTIVKTSLSNPTGAMGKETANLESHFGKD